MVNEILLIWGIIIFFIGILFFWLGNILNFKPLNWIGLIIILIGAGMAVFSVLYS
jgi:hypothetical protein